MKRIGIDARLYFQTGVGVYIRNILHYLQEQNTHDIEFYVYVMKNDSSRIHFRKDNFLKIEVPYKWHSFSEQIGFLVTLNNDKLDLMHFTYFSHPVLYNRPFIATMHDVILLEHKSGKASTLWPFFYKLKHLAFTYAFYHQINKSNVVITPTEVVKKQILSIFGTKFQDKIMPLHEGIDFKKTNIKENLDLRSQYTKKFFLYVGNFYPHKNVERLIKAFVQINEDIQLVLVGPKDYFYKRISELIHRLQKDKKIILAPNASDEDLVFFYKHAEALVHPSLSEGFGLPLIEAAHFNLPVVASDIPVFKEILGSHYLAFNPTDINDIKDKIVHSLYLPKEDLTTISHQFSFERMTEDILELYKQV